MRWRLLFDIGVCAVLACSCAEGLTDTTIDDDDGGLSLGGGKAAVGGSSAGGDSAGGDAAAGGMGQGTGGVQGVGGTQAANSSSMSASNSSSSNVTASSSTAVSSSAMSSSSMSGAGGGGVGCPPAPVGLSGCPSCGATCNAPWNAAWGASAGATHYLVEYQCFTQMSSYQALGTQVDLCSQVGMCNNSLCANGAGPVTVKACNQQCCSAAVTIPNTPIACGGGVCC